MIDAPVPGNWGRWGDTDERGAFNLVTPESVLRALRLPRTGEIIPLGTDVGRHGAVSHGRNPTWHVTITAEPPDDPGRGRAEDLLTMHTHAHSHIDGLAHVWYDDHLYNRWPATSVGRGGANRLSVGALGGLTARGVLLDLTLDTTRSWDVGDEILPAHLEAAAASCGVSLEPGDCVLLRTGWYDRFLDDDPKFGQGNPGLGVAATHWLLERDPILVGIDSWAVEPLPPINRERPLEIHEIFLRDHGVYLIELLDFTVLAARSPGPFLFVLTVLAIDRGLGSPVNPLAIL